jgi:hypothetical protein
MQSVKEAVLHLFHPRYSNHHRPRILHPEGFAVLCLFVLIFSLGLKNISSAILNYRHILGFSSTISVDGVIAGTNAQRTKLGLQSVTYNPVLSLAAEAKAKDMFEHQYWAHYSPAGKTPWDFMKNSGYRYVVAGENLARDFLDTDDMVSAWMNSPTHRDNLVNPRYQDIGVAVVNGTLNGTETTLVVQMFGSVTRSVASTNSVTTTAQIQVTPLPSQPVLAETDTQTIEQTKAEQLPQQTIATVENESAQEQVLAESLLRLTQAPPPLLSPLHVSKAFFLAIIILVVMVLVYDTIIIDSYQTVRFVGKNLAHIALFSVIFFLVLLFKGGVIV